VNVTANTTTA